MIKILKEAEKFDSVAEGDQQYSVGLSESERVQPYVNEKMFSVAEGDEQNRTQMLLVFSER